MAMTEKDLQEPKEKSEELNKEQRRLSDEDLQQVVGGKIFNSKNLEKRIEAVSKPD